jgi:predicted DCC family thiol-disulfide oxidoreductase YuxK
VLALPNQTPGLLAALGLSREQADAELWVIDAAGRRFSGAEAVNRGLLELPGWAWLAQLSRAPAVAWLQRRAYRWASQHRSLLSRIYSTTPACERPGAHCE